jgi:hypothetical protein
VGDRGECGDSGGEGGDRGEVGIMGELRVEEGAGAIAKGREEG